MIVSVLVLVVWDIDKCNDYYHYYYCDDGYQGYHYYDYVVIAIIYYYYYCYRLFVVLTCLGYR